MPTIPNHPPLPWADGAYSIKRHGVSLTNCDSEPVQMPGFSQPHGVVLVLRVSDLTILQLSENAAAHLGLGPEELLGRSIATVLADEGERRAAPAGPVRRERGLSGPPPGRRGSGRASRHHGDRPQKVFSTRVS